MSITFYFPTNYKHGNIGMTYYNESVNIMSISNRTQEFLSEVFKLTELYKRFKYLSFTPYLEWISLNGFKDKYYASPKIIINYNSYELRYFHVPMLSDVKFDFYLLTGTRNIIPDEKTSVIPIETSLEGEFIISL